MPLAIKMIGRRKPQSLRLSRRWKYLALSSLRCFGSASGLKVSVITGTTRTEGPPRPILGPRVASFVVDGLKRRGHEVSVIDPRKVGLNLLEKPEFAYARSQVPAELDELHSILAKSDAYVAVTPEYNHAPSPALLNIFNHFGSSIFSFKPSAIVSYSAGQWGGTRAAIALRPVLSELGCLPVSAMVHVPKAQEVFEEDGSLKSPEEEKEWEGYLNRCIYQLEWWGHACKDHRTKVDPFKQSPALQTSPSQRNAPK